MKNSARFGYARVTFEVAGKYHIAIKPAGPYAEVGERRNGFPVHWFDEWRAHGLEVTHAWQQEYTLPFTHEQWCGKIRSVSWMTNVGDRVRREVTQALMDALKSFDPVMKVPHRYSVVVLKNHG